MSDSLQDEDRLILFVEASVSLLGTSVSFLETSVSLRRGVS